MSFRPQACINHILKGRMSYLVLDRAHFQGSPMYRVMLIHDELWPFFKVYLACILIDWVHKKFTNVKCYEAT